jgi:hypothetical protein
MYKPEVDLVDFADREAIPTITALTTRRSDKALEMKHVRIGP